MAVLQLFLRLTGQQEHFGVVGLDDLGHEVHEMLVEAGCEGGIVAKLRKLTVDCSNNIDVIMLDEVEVLLFILL